MIHDIWYIINDKLQYIVYDLCYMIYDIFHAMRCDKSCFNILKLYDTG